MAAYKRLGLDDRVQIQVLTKRGISDAEIARELKVHRSSVGRERRRNRVEGKYYYHLAQDCAEKRQRLWLLGRYDACGGSLSLDISFSLAPPTALALAVAENPSRGSPCQRQRLVVSTAFDPAVTSYADVDRLLRTEPQVHLTPFMLNNHSNSLKSHGRKGPQRFSLALQAFLFLFRGVRRGYFSFGGKAVKL